MIYPLRLAETSATCHIASAEWVHPRVCGGNAHWMSYPRSTNGPSPRVRGKPVGASCASTLIGSIPACAGETWKNQRRKKREKVHPRVCGGKQAAHIESKVRMRSIPACAGKRPC